MSVKGVVGYPAFNTNFRVINAIKFLKYEQIYITGQTQQVLHNGNLSELQRLSYGVPHSSVLGPRLFNFYTVDISKVVEFHGHKVHQYADDCQVYCSFPVSERG